MSFLVDSGGGVLVTGGSGQLGTSFRSLLPDALFPDRSRLDLSRPETVREYVLDQRPRLIINCAAYTNVDLAEEQEDLATAVNGESVGELAAACATLDIPFVTFSTDYVFGGRSPIGYCEDDPTDPINAYGRSKLVGEQAALARHKGSTIIRTSWVVSPTHDNFVATMLKLAADPERSLKVVDDQRGRPTITSDLAVATLQAVEGRSNGILHLSNPPEVTWYGLAAEAIRLAGLPAAITPCATEEFPRPAPRPAVSTLLSARAAAFGVDELPDWRESLKGVVASQAQRLGLSA